MELIQELQIRGAASAFPLPTDTRIPASDLVFRKVTVAGQYMYEAEMHLFNQMRDGNPGINVFTPLIRADNGDTLLVNRGWVPIDWPGTPIEGHGVEAAVVEVTGVVRTPDPPGWLTSGNEPEQNNWYYIDLAGMSAAAGVLPFTDYYVFATGEKTLSGAPIPWLTPDPNEWHVDLPNNHLAYAITLFSLAGALFIFYVISHTRRRGPDDD